MHLAGVRGGPHEEAGRGARAVGAEEVSPLDARALQVLRHELLLARRVGQQLRGGGLLGVADQIQHLREVIKTER